MSKFTGGCLCGSIRYSIDRKYLNAFNCYCGMCRKAHGGAFSTHALTRQDQITFSPDITAMHTYESSPGAFREFCPHCGTHLLIHGQTDDGSYAVPAGTLDGDPALTLVAHIFVADKVGWYQITDSLPQHAQWPSD